MSDNHEFPPHVLNHLQDLGMSPPGSDQTSPAEQPSSEGSNSGRFSLDFLKLGLGSRRKDGEKPKRRGPKPDSKPALTRRQELNRQAQRYDYTLLYLMPSPWYILYIPQPPPSFLPTQPPRHPGSSAIMPSNNSALTERIEKGRRTTPRTSRLKPHGMLSYLSKQQVESKYRESLRRISLAAEFTKIQKEKALVVEENQRLLEETNRLKAILESHGISYTPQNGYTMGGQQQRQDPFPPPEVTRFGRSYNEIGIDFVLALEKPCMDHIQLMFGNIEKNTEADFHGHRLMVSCPPEPQYMNQHAEVPWGQQTWDLAANELYDLFNMQDRFGLEGELTPIAVWALVSQHPNFSHLDLNDFKSLAEGLVLKVKCHGFGAVIEEFEVQDSLASLFSKKQGSAVF